ncbi:hypothetical protein B0H16DRAFT_1480373 [Mycena metata]|uniref:Uncharacterized protein n=1 Tax=Mycena metata TaxID=1033252 RepID=A0AAD7MD97_9AGAR|nr:hypothetical protein B0H16DRAFT_1480373 [Mycena metata]
MEPDDDDFPIALDPRNFDGNLEPVPPPSQQASMSHGPGAALRSSASSGSAHPMSAFPSDVPMDDPGDASPVQLAFCNLADSTEESVAADTQALAAYMWSIPEDLRAPFLQRMATVAQGVMAELGVAGEAKFRIHLPEGQAHEQHQQVVGAVRYGERGGNAENRDVGDDTFMEGDNPGAQVVEGGGTGVPETERCEMGKGSTPKPRKKKLVRDEHRLGTQDTGRRRGSCVLQGNVVVDIHGDSGALLVAEWVGLEEVAGVWNSGGLVPERGWSEEESPFPPARRMGGRDREWNPPT